MLADRRSDVVGLGIGGAVLGATGTLARRGVSDLEAHLFRVVNDLPDGAFPAVWVPMQYGTFGTVPLAAALALARRRPRLSVALMVAGTAAWLSAKAFKPLVARGRPNPTLTNVNLRGSEEGDLGFPSGHAAVSAALTIVAWPHVSNGWRRTLMALSAFVPFARMYVGAHLPLDAIGGSALGVAVGCAADLVLGVRTDRTHHR